MSLGESKSQGPRAPSPAPKGRPSHATWEGVSADRIPILVCRIAFQFLTNQLVMMINGVQTTPLTAMTRIKQPRVVRE
jgi:hypothetical protein